MKKQIILIHGGDTFNSYEEYITFLKDFPVDQNYFDKRFRQKGWKDTLGDGLGSDFEVIKPRMPNESYCRYSEWKIWFDKLTPFFNDNVILIGHSMGGIFLAKYLSENKFPKKIIATYLVAPPYDDESTGSLGDFKLNGNLSLLEKQGGEIFVMQSEDDPVVLFADAEKYKNELLNCKFIVFKDRGHFSQTEFPEIVSSIKNLH